MSERGSAARSRARPGLLLLILLSTPGLGAGQETPGGCRIAIDIGHTSSRPGATSARGIGEFVFNQSMARLVREQLRAQGVTAALLVNEEGRDIPLQERTEIANEWRADLLVSIHHDSAQPRYLSTWTWEGQERSYSDLFQGYSLFYSRKNPRAAESLEIALRLGSRLRAAGLEPTLHHAEEIEGENRELVDEERGVYIYDDLVVLKTAAMPAVLVECGVILNRQEEERLSDPAYQTTIARAIAEVAAETCRQAPAPAPAAGSPAETGHAAPRGTAAAPSGSPGCEVERAFEFAPTGSTVWTAGDRALLFEGDLDIDIDGAPNAYHPRGRPAGALDTLCNAGRALLPDGTRFEGYERCADFLDAVDAARAAGWTDPDRPRIEWYGVVTEDDAGHVPAVQTEGPFAGFYVSATSLQDASRPRGDPGRYLDSLRIPFFVLPGRSPFLGEGGVRLGALGLAYWPDSDRAVPAIFGDVGPSRKLGEGSIALARLLRGVPLDEPADRHTAARLVIASGVHYLVFPDARLGPPFTAERIEEAVGPRFAAWGGRDRLRACAAELAGR